MEYEIEKLYDRMSMTHELREHIEDWLNKQIQESADDFIQEKALLQREKEKLERQRSKLLEAHYADAIPLELLKSEEDRISRAMIDIDDEIAIHDTHYEVIRDNLKLTLDLVEDCGRAYKLASDNMKRAFNQAIFERIEVDEDGKIEPIFTSSFKILIDLKDSRIVCVFAASTDEAAKEDDCS